MTHYFRRPTLARSLLAILLLLAFVAAQGMRFCQHAAAGDSGAGSGLHLEADLMSPDADDGGLGDEHFEFGLGLAKQVANSVFAAMLVTTVLMLLLPLSARQVLVFQFLPILPSGEHRRRPPSRGPPR